ncbi:MAG TPA: TatD family hydrolase [Candidatus Saccharimonadales bacterium]|nr:TatD family hydrolase [Candidatus Saccharimonadales bacterium]
MELIDTHCHLQFKDYDNPNRVIADAKKAGVSKLICVGTDIADSQTAIDIATSNDNVWATVGIHPHEAKDFLASAADDAQDIQELLKKPKVVAIGEIGLDFYKNYSPREDQIKALRMQIEAGAPTGMPFVFHVRDAFEDFWPIFDSYSNLRGVIHSFSAHKDTLDQTLSRGLYVALNGIMTFTKDSLQLEAAKAVPLNRLLLETDAPFLTPNAFRGQRCEPKHLIGTAEFLAELRGEKVEELASATTANAMKLFGLHDE